MARWWVSYELTMALMELTGQQAEAIVRIVEAEKEGRKITSLLEGPEKICAWVTFHGGGDSKGWKNLPTFQNALALARRDYRAARMQAAGTGKAVQILDETAPAAAQALQQRVQGNEQALTALVRVLAEGDMNLRANAAYQLGQTGLPKAVRALERQLEVEENPKVLQVIVEALGICASGGSRDQSAAESVLDRAGLKTAKKEQQALTGADGGAIQVGVLGLVGQMDDEELERLIRNLEAAETVDGEIVQEVGG